MLDPAAIQFFSTQQEAAANQVCADSGATNPEWASISHGIYISIGASGVHRSLGVRTSFVQSMTMDSWKPLHLKMMELGGNQRFQEFLDEHGIPRDMPIREKYQTRAAAWYRGELRALAEGTSPPAPLPQGTGHLPASDGPTDTERMLDEVYASAPHAASMTKGGVPKFPTSARGKGPRPVRARSQSPEPAATSGKRCALAELMHWQLQSTIELCKWGFAVQAGAGKVGTQAFDLQCTDEDALKAERRGIVAAIAAQ